LMTKSTPGMLLFVIILLAVTLLTIISLLFIVRTQNSTYLYEKENAGRDGSYDASLPRFILD
jgi:hypothetical protein